MGAVKKGLSDFPVGTREHKRDRGVTSDVISNPES